MTEFATGDRILYHDPNASSGYAITEGSVAEVKTLPGGAVVYTLTLDDGRRVYPDPTRIHPFPPTASDLDRCPWCKSRLEQTESPAWPGPNVPGL